MEKTTVYLSAEQKAALARTAAAEGRSEATLIRSGIDVVTARHRSGEAAAAYLSDGEEARHTGSARDDAEPGGLPRRPRWISRDVFIREILPYQADAGLLAELKAMLPGTTDDEPIP